MIIIYVDDMLVIGNKEIIEELKTKVEEVFSIKTEDNLTDYLGCEFHMNKNKTKGWFRQPSIIKNMEKKIGKESMMTPRKSSTDLLSDPQILQIPTSNWYQMEGRAPRPPNQLSLSGHAR